MLSCCVADPALALFPALAPLSVATTDASVPAAGAASAVELDVPLPEALAAFVARDVSALRTISNAPACVACSAARLNSRLTIVPFCVVPLITAAGRGWSAGGTFAAGTGTIPMVESVVSVATGRDTVIGVVGSDVADENVGCEDVAGAAAVALAVRCGAASVVVGVRAVSGVCAREVVELPEYAGGVEVYE